jgi:hypothetical protein
MFNFSSTCLTLVSRTPAVVPRERRLAVVETWQLPWLLLKVRTDRFFREGLLAVLIRFITFSVRPAKREEVKKKREEAGKK